MRRVSSELLIAGRQLSISTRWPRVARLADEWFEDVEDPAAFVNELKSAGVPADVLSFWQRLPTTEPCYHYQCEWDATAVLRVSTYDHWYKKQINNKTRNLIVKAQKRGIEVRPAEFNDAFVRGMTAIFNETPLRQERPYLHYGKDFQTVKRQFARYLFRERLFGAYLGDQLVGFIMLGEAGSYTYLGQIISLIAHRDKSPTNALMAKAVEDCAERGCPLLVYALWPRGPLREFKRHNGFECVRVPRYNIPLNGSGALAIRLGLHRDLADRLPETMVSRLKSVRSRYYSLRYGTHDREAKNTSVVRP